VHFKGSMPLKYRVFIQLNSSVRSWYYVMFFFLRLAWCGKNNLFWMTFMTKKARSTSLSCFIWGLEL